MPASYICSDCSAKFHAIKSFVDHRCDDRQAEYLDRGFPTCSGCGSILNNTSGVPYCPVCEA